MARAYTESGKERIRRTLLQKGRDYFIKYGLKKTSVEELAKAAGIAKGSFYKFFDSKESLFMAVHEESEGKLRQDMMQKLEAVAEPVEKIRMFFKGAFLILEEDPLLRMVFSPGEMEALSGFMSSDKYEEHYRQDIRFMEEFFRRWQVQGIVRPDVDIAVVGNLVVSVFHIVLQKEALGKEMYDRVTDMQVECLAGYLAVKKRGVTKRAV